MVKVLRSFVRGPLEPHVAGFVIKELAPRSLALAGLASALRIAETCPLILPIHRDLDGLREDARRFDAPMEAPEWADDPRFRTFGAGEPGAARGAEQRPGAGRSSNRTNRRSACRRRRRE